MRLLVLLFPLLASLTSTAQWVVEGVLAEIPVVEDCGLTGGECAKIHSDDKGRWTLNTCANAIAAMDAAVPDASHFFVVREYAYRAMNTTSDEGADVWAAVALALAPNAKHYLNAAVAHLHARAIAGDPARPGLGTPMDRIKRIEAAGAQVNADLKWNTERMQFE